MLLMLKKRYFLQNYLNIHKLELNVFDLKDKILYIKAKITYNKNFTHYNQVEELAVVVKV